MSLRRKMAVAGQFYPAAAEVLHKQVQEMLTRGAALAQARKSDAAKAGKASLLGVMLPHAGHVYCGQVIGATLGAPWEGGTTGACLPRRLLILCPNHTGLGARLGVWPEGNWETPLGDIAVDADMAGNLCGCGGFTADTASHAHEHSIEVLLPFFQCLWQGAGAACRIVPVCVGASEPQLLRAAAHAIAETLRRCAAAGDPAGVVVSSDMNHYENVQQTLLKDGLALARLAACDGAGLLGVTASRHISMCGVAPMAMALFAAEELGLPWAEVCAHDTSASVTGDATHVVGYAGARFGVAV